MKITECSLRKTILSPLIDKILEVHIPEYKAIYDGMQVPLTALEEATWCSSATVSYNALTKSLTFTTDVGNDVLYNGTTGVITDTESLVDKDIFAKTYSLYVEDRSKGCSRSIILESDQYKYIKATTTDSTVTLSYEKPANILNVDVIEIPMNTIEYKVKGTDTVIPNMTMVVSPIDNTVLKELTDLNHLEAEIYVDGVKLPIEVSLPVDNRNLNVATTIYDVINGLSVFYNISFSTGARDEFTTYTYYLDGVKLTNDYFELTTELIGKVFTTLLSENEIQEQLLSNVPQDVYIAKEDLVIQSSSLLDYYIDQGYYTLAGTTLSGTQKSVDFLLDSYTGFAEDIPNFTPLLANIDENSEPISMTNEGLILDVNTGNFVIDDVQFPVWKLGYKKIIFNEPYTITTISDSDSIDELFSITAPNNEITIDGDLKLSPTNLSTGLLKTTNITSGNKIINIDCIFSFTGNQNTSGRASILVYDRLGTLLAEFGFKRDLDGSTILKRNGTEKKINVSSYINSEVHVITNITDAAQIGIIIENNSTDVFSIKDLIITTKDQIW